ncbi:LysR family transcriptional regulator [Hyphomicrobium facile]|uniref:DNA-binding transcriptional regulator, LysR family n=1 Tax=Hyphomicrobium facile TaxID=51670 RepID=A0A1I7N589_9HYPH|nr:LysR family transcriptional regulator [Hyphomicrobium facile]SFV29805.1 DNA-binding transcriptional regulator, LysR family [Hyphomicrobium facile]
MTTTARIPRAVDLRFPWNEDTAMAKNIASFSRNLDWNLLKTFHEIAQSGGISRASGALSRKQPALSLALKRLESQLGVKLCERGPSGFALTDEGMLIADSCGSINGLVQQLPKKVSKAGDSVAGRVSIQVVSCLVCDQLDSAISRFHGSHPKAEIIIDIKTGDSVAGALLRDEIDIGVAPASALRSDLKYDFLFNEVHRPYVGPAHRLFGRTFDDPGALASEAFILTGADEPGALTEFRTRHGLGRVVAGLSEHLDAAKRLTLLNVGICFLPEKFAEPDVQAGRLWPLIQDTERPSTPVFIITNPRAPRKLARQLLLSEISGSLETD